MWNRKMINKDTFPNEFMDCLKKWVDKVNKTCFRGPRRKFKQSEPFPLQGFLFKKKNVYSFHIDLCFLPLDGSNHDGFTARIDLGALNPVEFCFLSPDQATYPLETFNDVEELFKAVLAADSEQLEVSINGLINYYQNNKNYFSLKDSLE